MPEVETPTSIDETSLAVQRGSSSKLDRWVEAGPEQALAKVEALVKTLEVLRVASIKATYPSDWLIHTSTNPAGEVTRQVGYLQDCGAERAGKIWGIEVGQPIIEREEHPDGTFSYHMLADAWSRVTGERVENAEGSRWSGSRFFARSVAADEKVDPTVVRKSAFANLHGRCVRALGGLSAVPLDVLRTAGIDISKVMMIAYEQGAKGGESTGASVGTTDVVMAWGNSKGVKVQDLPDKDLAFYLGAYERDVADPGKAKYLRNNERMLTALKAEKERREKSAAHEAETGTGPGAGESGTDGKPTPRGTKLGNLQIMLTDAVGKGHVAALLRVLSAEHLKVGEKSSLSDLTDEDLDKLLTIPAEDLKKIGAAVIGAEKKK